MGVEMIKDRQGKEHLVFSDEDFYNDDIMGDKFEDYEIMQVFSSKSNKKFVSKVRSKFNSKIYAMKKIDKEYLSNLDEKTLKEEYELFKSMNNPNVTKYFKYFYQDECLYLVSEYVNNSDLNRFLNAYKSLDKPIETNTLWNIFMQCISALKYIHSKNITHKNIKLSNIFMTENKVVKLGDFRLSFLDDKSNQNSKKADIYALGEVFHNLCYFASPGDSWDIRNKDYYPKEMDNIIKMMLEKDENKRVDTEGLHILIMDQYIKNVIRISSIDSVFRCMCSFKNFTDYLHQNFQTFSNREVTPVSYDFINCFQNYFSGMLEENAVYLNNFRDLVYNYSQINNEIELKPSLVIEYLLEKLNKEMGTKFQGPSLGTLPIFFDNNKEKAYSLFLDNYKKKFNSKISEYFVGFIKTKRICQNPNCLNGIYSFNLFPFIEFDLDRCKNDLNLQNWFKIQNNHCLILSQAHNIICQACKCITPHNEFKQFFNLPQNFIISINRGEGFKNTSIVKFPEILDLESMIERKDSYHKFKLLGIVKRMIDNKGNEYYIAVYFDQFLSSWVISEKKRLTRINNPFEHKEGMVLLLFYSAIITTFGE